MKKTIGQIMEENKEKDFHLYDGTGVWGELPLTEYNKQNIPDRIEKDGNVVNFYVNQDTKRESPAIHLYKRLNAMGYGTKQSGAGSVFYIVRGKKMTVAEYQQYCIKRELKNRYQIILQEVLVPVPPAFYICQHQLILFIKRTYTYQ